jgi:biopolymer transport protein ExbB/TolQ
MSDFFSSHGGVAGLGVLLAQVVLWGYSIVSFAVILERAVVLRRERSAEFQVYPRLRDHARAGNIAGFESMMSEGNAPSLRALSEVRDDSLDVAQRRDLLDDEIERQTAALSKNLTVLATVASTAPYVGLFGTVLGILRAFADIAATGQTGASVVAGGISEALVTTAIGLGVAIPAVIAYNFFSQRLNALSFEVDSHARDLLARWERLRGQTGLEGAGS